MKKSTWINVGIVAFVAIVVVYGLTHMKNKDTVAAAPKPATTT